jgi:hypothetical protein
MPTDEPATPETATPETPSPIPTPAEAVEGGAKPEAVAAATTDTAMPEEAEEDPYANFAGEGHEKFGGAKTTRGKTSRAIVDAMRGYEGDDFGELEEAVRAVPTKSGGKRRLTPYHRRMMEQHAKRRGFGPGMETPDDMPTDDEPPKAPDAPDAPEADMPTEEPEEVKARPLVAMSEDPMNSAWNALMILKHR